MSTTRSIAIVAMAACASLAQASPTYSVQELLLSGGVEGRLVQVFGISPRIGLVAGNALASGDTMQNAAVWQDGTPLTLAAPGAASSWAMAVNDRGLVAGYIEDANLADQPVLWTSDGRIHPLPTFQQGAWAQARGIANTGDIVGSDASIGGPVLWHHRIEHAMPMPDALTWGAARAISHQGTYATGYAGDGGAIVEAVLWTSGVPLHVGPTGTPTWGFGVNDAGQVVGSYRNLSNMDTPFLATASGYITLPLLKGHIAATASAINDHGVAVGASWCGCGGISRAVRWSNGHAVDLNSVLDDASRAAGWNLISAVAIDEAGRILAVGTHGSSDWLGVVLVPNAQ